MRNIIAYLILSATIVFNLWLNYPETQILADPNDNIFQFSLVGRTNWVWENYGCPFSLSCLPNLVDHNVPNWAEGYPLPFYYSHVPQIATVASYNLIVKPLITQLLNYPITLYQYYNWTKYLILAFFPVSIFLALKLVGFSPVAAALAAFLGTNFSTDGLYGIDPPSYLWRGYGLTSQLYATVFFPLAIAFVYRALSAPSSLPPKSPKLPRLLMGNNLLLASLFLTLTTAGHLGIGIIGIISTLPFLFLDFKVTNIVARFKKLFLILTSCFVILSYWLIPILLNNNYHIISFWDPIWKFDSYGWYEVARQFLNGEIFDWQRFPIITILVVIGFFVTLINSPHSPSYNAPQPPLKVRGGEGELRSVNLFPFPLLFALWFLLYFGRTTWGGLIDLIPGMKDFHQSRFVVGVHLAALFLIPAGLECLFQRAFAISSKIRAVGSDFVAKLRQGKRELTERSEGIPEGFPRNSAYKSDPRTHLARNTKARYPNIIFYILILTFISALAYFTTKQTIAYAQLNNKWIYEANSAYRYDEKNFQSLLSKIDSLPYGRIYAGRPGNWGKAFRLGSTQLYLLLGGLGYDISQFLPETWSPLSENEQNFDEREALDFDLLNIRYTVSSNLPAGLPDGKAGEAGNEGSSPSVRMKDKFGPFELYESSSSGWFDVVTSPMLVKSDKTNYLNIVGLWWKSYARRWKMHPLISVEKNPTIPDGVLKTLEMKDEVTYTEGGNSPLPPLNVRGGEGGVKNIFSDYPFVFPESTVSAVLIDSLKNTPGVAGRSGNVGHDSPGVKEPVAIISNEKVYKQSYSATIEVPNNCKQCFAMFKMSYHPDWQVKVDGKDADKFAVFPFYLAAAVTPGTHQVEFAYQPNRLKVILLTGEIIFLGIMLILRKRTKSSS